MLRCIGPGFPKESVGGGLTTHPIKNKKVTETQASTLNFSHILGDGGVSALADLMKDSGQSHKEVLMDATGQKPSSLNKSLRIASWNVRTMYEAGKSAQVSKEMHRYRLHILGISETHWIQSRQKRLSSGELILYAGREDKNTQRV